MERDIFLYRSYIALQKYRIVVDEIHGASKPRLQPLKLLAEYFTASNRDVVVGKLDDILSKDIDSSNETLFIVAGTIYFNERNYDSALRILHQADSIEAYVRCLQVTCHFKVISDPHSRCKFYSKLIGRIWLRRRLLVCRLKMKTPR